MTDPERPVSWDDELTETMLSEAMGRVTPPDLTDRIARELEMAAPVTGAMAAPPATTPRRHPTPAAPSLRRPAPAP